MAGYSPLTLFKKLALSRAIEKEYWSAAAAASPEALYRLTRVSLDDSLTRGTAFYLVQPRKGRQASPQAQNDEFQAFLRKGDPVLMGVAQARSIRLDAAADNLFWLEVREWAQSIAIALLLTLVIRTYVVQAFKIPSGSMRPTLMEGDKLFVNKFVYRFESPQRGDIVVFKYPRDRKKDFIKRLIAFGGETVEIRNGKIFIDGKKVELPALQKFYYYNHEDYGGPGVLIHVPEDSFYVLGDNSANSTDSRFWGFVPKKDMIGKAIFRWWPLNRLGRLD